jgi:membrane protease subunit HflK
MAWNEPGKDQNPWGNRGGGNNDGPPDLDEAFRKLQDKINGMFGGNKSGNSGSGIGGLLVLVLIIAPVYIKSMPKSVQLYCVLVPSPVLRVKV